MKKSDKPQAAPGSPEAVAAASFIEICALGAMLIEPRWVTEGLTLGLKPEAFTHGERSQVWEAMAKMAAEGEGIEPGLVARRLVAMGAIGAVNLEVLRGWAEAVEVPGFCRNWLAQILASWRQRQAATIAMTLAEALNLPAANYADLAAKIQKGVSQLSEVGTFAGGRDERAAMTELKVRASREETGSARWTSEQLVSMGVRALDNHPGWRRPTPGQVIVVAARPGMGKSSLLRQAGWAGLAAGKVVVFHSLEMPVEEQAWIMAGLTTLIPSEVENRAAWIASHAKNAPKWREFLSNLNRLEEWAGRTWFPRDHIKDVDALVADVRGIVARAGRVDLVLVDYLQLLTCEVGKGAKREVEVAQISRKLKSLTLEFGCTVIVAAQLNRDTEKENRAPRLSDLRESGAIEQDADKVLAIWQPKEDGNGTQQSGLRAQLRRFIEVLKNRRGKVGFNVTVNFKGDATAFISIPEKPENRGCPPKHMSVDEWREQRLEEQALREFREDMGARDAGAEQADLM